MIEQGPACCFIAGPAHEAWLISSVSLYLTSVRHRCMLKDRRLERGILSQQHSILGSLYPDVLKSYKCAPPAVPTVEGVDDD